MNQVPAHRNKVSAVPVHSTSDNKIGAAISTHSRCRDRRADHEVVLDDQAKPRSLLVYRMDTRCTTHRCLRASDLSPTRHSPSPNQHAIDLFFLALSCRIFSFFVVVVVTSGMGFATMWLVALILGLFVARESRGLEVGETIWCVPM